MKQNKIIKSYYIVEGNNTHYNTLSELYTKCIEDNIDITSINIIKCYPEKLNNKILSHIYDKQINWEYLTRKHLRQLITNRTILNTNPYVCYICSHVISDYITKYINAKYTGSFVLLNSELNKFKTLFSDVIFADIRINNCNNITFYQYNDSYYIVFNNLYNCIAGNDIILKLRNSNSITYVEISSYIERDIEKLEILTKQDHDNIIKLFKSILDEKHD